MLLKKKNSLVCTIIYLDLWIFVFLHRFFRRLLKMHKMHCNLVGIQHRWAIASGISNLILFHRVGCFFFSRSVCPKNTTFSDTENTIKELYKNGHKVWAVKMINMLFCIPLHGRLLRGSCRKTCCAISQWVFCNWSKILTNLRLTLGRSSFISLHTHSQRCIYILCKIKFKFN